MKTVMRITALVVFCLALSPSAVPQQKTPTNDPKPRATSECGAVSYSTNKTNSGVGWPKTRR